MTGLDFTQPAVRKELLLVLTSSSRVCAYVVRQFHERGKDDMVEVLTELEADDLLRLQVIDALLRENAHSQRG